MSAEEQVDIVDAQDRVIGRATRAEVRARNLLHRCVYLLVFDSRDRIFVHQRTDTKDVFPGYWDVAVGGVVGAGEGYLESAQRELHEELGVRAAPLQQLFPFQYEDVHSRVQGMVYRCVSNGPFQLQATEVVTGEWVPWPAILPRVTADTFCPDGLVALQRYHALRQQYLQG